MARTRLTTNETKGDVNAAIAITYNIFGKLAPEISQEIERRLRDQLEESPSQEQTYVDIAEETILGEFCRSIIIATNVVRLVAQEVLTHDELDFLRNRNQDIGRERTAETFRRNPDLIKAVGVSPWTSEEIAALNEAALEARADTNDQGSLDEIHRIFNAKKVGVFRTQSSVHHELKRLMRRGVIEQFQLGRRASWKQNELQFAFCLLNAKNILRFTHREIVNIINDSFHAGRAVRTVAGLDAQRSGVCVGNVEMDWNLIGPLIEQYSSQSELLHQKGIHKGKPDSGKIAAAINNRHFRGERRVSPNQVKYYVFTHKQKQE